MILIPFDPKKSADQTLRVQLGSQLAELRFLYNIRARAWFLDLRGSFGEALGLKITPGWPILRGRESASSFEGDFIVQPLTSQVVGQEIGYFDLGVSWGFLWMTPAEKDAWEVHFGLE